MDTPAAWYKNDKESYGNKQGDAGGQVWIL